MSFLATEELVQRLSEECVEDCNCIVEPRQPLSRSKIFVWKIGRMNMSVALQSKKFTKFTVVSLKWIDDFL